MRKCFYVLIVVSILVLGYFTFKPKKVDSNIKKIDSLELEISAVKSKRDSIKGRIDTTIIKIKENEKYYKETVSTIINNTTDDDYIFFINYLKFNRERYDSINYSDSIKRN